MLPQDQRRTRAVHVAYCAISVRLVRNSSIVNNIKINTRNVYCTYLTMSIAVYLAVQWEATLRDLKKKKGSSIKLP
jgi:hypothetical protein